MANMEMMSRVLVDHNWTSIEEWGRAVRALADLDDQALVEIERLRKPAKKVRRDSKVTRASTKGRASG